MRCLPPPPCSAAVRQEGDGRGVWRSDAEVSNTQRPDGRCEWLKGRGEDLGLQQSHTHSFFCHLQISEKYGVPTERIAKVYKKSKKGWARKQTAVETAVLSTWKQSVLSCQDPGEHGRQHHRALLQRGHLPAAHRQLRRRLQGHADGDLRGRLHVQQRQKEGKLRPPAGQKNPRGCYWVADKLIDSIGDGPSAAEALRGQRRRVWSLSDTVTLRSASCPLWEGGDESEKTLREILLNWSRLFHHHRSFGCEPDWWSPRPPQFHLHKRICTLILALYSLVLFIFCFAKWHIGGLLQLAGLP